MAPGAETVFNFGKHRGQTFQYVVDNHKGYAAWCLEQKHLRSQLRDFAMFIRKSGVDVSSSQAIPGSQGVPASQASVPASQPSATFQTQTASIAVSGLGRGGGIPPSAPSKPPAPAAAPAAAPAPAPAPPPPAAPAAPVAPAPAAPAPPAPAQAAPAPAAPAPVPVAPAAAAVAVRGLAGVAVAAEPVTPPCKARQDQMAGLQATPAPAAAAAVPVLGAAVAAPGQAAQPAPAVPSEGPFWSTGDKAMDAFLSATVDENVREKFVLLPVTRRVAVARLLQARHSSVRNFQAYAAKVVNTACQGQQEAAAAAATTQDLATQPMAPSAEGMHSQLPMSQATQRMPGAPMGLEQPQLPLAAQQQQAMQCSQPAMQPVASQCCPMLSQGTMMSTQNTVLPMSQAVPMQGMPMQQQGQVMQQPGMQPWQQGMGAPMQGQMCMQLQGQMAMQQPPGPYGQPCSQQGAPFMMLQEAVAPQMSPWARVLAHLESKGIPFADIKSCHMDTRRDILKEVFLKEPLARAQAEMEWMKAKANAQGQSGASRSGRARSRSRDRTSQGMPGARPGAPGAGLSYIMKQ